MHLGHTCAAGEVPGRGTVSSACKHWSTCLAETALLFAHTHTNVLRGHWDITSATFPTESSFLPAPFCPAAGHRALGNLCCASSCTCMVISAITAPPLTASSLKPLNMPLLLLQHQLSHRVVYVSSEEGRVCSVILSQSFKL